MLTLNYDGETLNPWTSGLSLRVCSCSLASVSLVLSVDSTLIQLRWRLMFFLLSHHVGDNIIVICLNFRFSYLQLRITTRMLMFAPTWQLIIIMLHELKQQQVCNNYLNCSFARLKQVIICRKKKKSAWATAAAPTPTQDPAAWKIVLPACHCFSSSALWWNVSSRLQVCLSPSFPLQALWGDRKLCSLQ